MNAPNWYSLWAIVPVGGHILPTSNPLVVQVYLPEWQEYELCRWRSASMCWELESCHKEMVES